MSESIPKWRRVLPLQWLCSVVYTGLLFVDSLGFGFVITLFGWLPFRQLYGFARAWALTNLWLLRVNSHHGAWLLCIPKRQPPVAGTHFEDVRIAKINRLENCTRLNASRIHFNCH